MEIQQGLYAFYIHESLAERRLSMLFKGKRGLGFLLAGVLLTAMPGEAFASEISQEQNQTEILEAETEDTLIDFEKEGYLLRFTGGEQYEYTGGKIEPEFVILRKEDEKEQTVKLDKDTDYTAEYNNNIEVSADSGKKPTLTVKGISNGKRGYKGTLKLTFEIVEEKKSADNNETSELSAEDGPGTENGVGVENNVRAEHDDEFKEQNAEMSVNDCMVTLAAQSFYCDGKAKTPAVTVRHKDNTLVPGTDYTVSYENNVNVGTASAVITGIGRYMGEKRVNFMIKLGSTSLESVSSYSKISLSWGAVSGAAGYEVYKSREKASGFKLAKRVSSGMYSYADGAAKFNETYYYRVRAYSTAEGQTVYGEWSPVKAQKKQVAAPKIRYVKISSGRMKIAWKKTEGASGYVLYRSNSEKGKYKKIAFIESGSKVSYTDKKISTGKVYYYKVKAYRQVKKKKHYGLSSDAAHNAVPKKEIVNSGTSGSGWRYVNGYKLYYDNNGKLVKDVSKIIGKQSSYVIKVNKKKNCVTVYAKDGKNGYIIPVKAFPCSAGYATPITTARTPAKYRWHRLNGNCYGQWCTRIKQGYLFHSVMYGRTKNTSLSVRNYNKLGRTASHGCIRLRAGDAKWIYENCRLKTKVIIYNSSNPGPLGKPSAVKLPKWHRWDPTDPTARALCTKRGCH